MHIYIYDTYVNDRRNNSILTKIETRITDLGLNGKIIRINALNSINEIVDNEIKKGASTIVAVGNDNIFNEVLNSLLKISKKNNIIQTPPMGFIPIDKKNNNIAHKLGIPFNEKACDILSVRRIKILDLGKINNYYFLTQATIPSEGTILEINESYTIELKKSGKIIITNFPLQNNYENKKISAFDSKLELFVQISKSKKFLNFFSTEQSFFNFNTVKIINKKWPVIIDNGQKINTPAIIKISSKKINLIVNKNVLL